MHIYAQFFKPYTVTLDIKHAYSHPVFGDFASIHQKDKHFPTIDAVFLQHKKDGPKAVLFPGIKF